MGIISVITTTGDVHVPLVQKHLPENMTIIDPLKLLSRNSSLSIKTGPNTAIPDIAYSDIDLRNITAVWYRKPQHIRPTDIPLQHQYRPYASDALERLFALLYNALVKAYWISDYYAIQRAGDKAWQLEVAKRIGFNVPETLFSSDERQAAAFIKQHKSVIMKPMSFVRIIGENNPKAMFATLVDDKNPPRLDTLHISPLIFQRAIKVKHEVRVTVVGNKVFPARVVHSEDKDATVRDWRIGHFDGKLEITKYKNFPKDIAQYCIEHVRALGLAYGAIDLIVDKSNTFWFLENNPNGQWGFVELLTGQPIGEAIASLLRKPPSSNKEPRTMERK